ncbi:MAG: OB-fold nucleic acid binding domain-containing protein, partial [Planctomycetota bacterium]|nr:OB-fold nucleic acid binding domain-containing protein [Planctomycetota bacterium]
GFSFLELNDGSSLKGIQVVADGELPNYESEILHAVTGCSLRVVGELKESQGKGQSVEILAKSIEVLGWVENPENYPMQKKRHSMEFLREVAHLRPRSNTFGAVARVR